MKENACTCACRWVSERIFGEKTIILTVWGFCSIFFLLSVASIHTVVCIRTKSTVYHCSVVLQTTYVSCYDKATEQPLVALRRKWLYACVRRSQFRIQNDLPLPLSSCHQFFFSLTVKAWATHLICILVVLVFPCCAVRIFGVIKVCESNWKRKKKNIPFHVGFQTNFLLCVIACVLLKWDDLFFVFFVCH